MMHLTTDDLSNYVGLIDHRIRKVEVSTEFDGTDTLVKIDVSVKWETDDDIDVRKQMTEGWTTDIKQGCVPLGCMVKCRYIEVFLRYGEKLQ